MLLLANYLAYDFYPHLIFSCLLPLQDQTINTVNDADWLSSISEQLSPFIQAVIKPVIVFLLPGRATL